MKITTDMTTCVKGLIGAATLALVLPATAIENPKAEEAPKQKENKAAAAEEAPKENQKPVEKVAMLGVGGASASETLSTHLGLAEGQGLTVYHVVPGSAAAKAGFEAHDVITEFAGQKIGNQQDLREAVLNQKPGDEVVVKFIHKGKAEEKKIVLGERPDMPHMQPQADNNPWMRHLGNMPEADVKRLRQEMKKQLENMQKQLGQGGVELDLLNLQHVLPDAQLQQLNKNGQPMNFGAVATVTLMDEHGSVSMKTVDGKREVTVKDKAGKVLFEGPYQTDQDKAAVPDDVRDRIERLNFGENGKNGFRLNILPGALVPPPPVDPNEDDVAE